MNENVTESTIPDVSDLVDIDELKKASLNRIPKNVFIRNYAPLMFSGDPGAFNSAWIRVASSTTHEVLMVDDRGDVIYTIPPLRVSEIRSRDKGVELNKAVSLYDRRKHTAPGQANNELIDSLKKVDFTIGVTEELQQRWIDLFIFCGFEEEIKKYSMKPVEVQSSVSLWEDC